MAGTREGGGEKSISNGLAGILKGLANLVEIVGKMEKEGLLEIKESGKTGSGKNIKAVYGYTVRLGLEGASGQPRPSREWHEKKETPKDDEVREPIVDVIPEDDHYLIIAEMPGVEETDVEIIFSGESALITAQSRKSRRIYRKHLTLEGLKSPVQYDSNYRNGILEIKAKKNQ